MIHVYINIDEPSVCICISSHACMHIYRPTVVHVYIYAAYK